MITAAHTPVMESEVITGLKIKADGIYIDATFGRGGHTKGILACLGSTGRVLVIDKDPEAIAAARQLQTEDVRVIVYHGSFADILTFCEAENIVGKVNGVVLDLGLSSPQIEHAARGFSFLKDGPLDMRMDPNHGVTAAEWLAKADEDKIREVLKNYGEEKYAKRIAHAICRARQDGPITTTKALTDIISSVYPRKFELNKHPATRTFQGIRIFINNELDDLRKALAAMVNVLAIAGRIVVISFHSLEDRIVKQFINDAANGSKKIPYKLPVRAATLQPLLKKIGKLQPRDEEIQQNIRARSAILRIAEKLPMVNK